MTITQAAKLEMDLLDLKTLLRPRAENRMEDLLSSIIYVIESLDAQLFRVMTLIGIREHIFRPTDFHLLILINNYKWNIFY